MSDHNELHCRRAIESLRSGVPNEDVITRLASEQATIKDRYAELLDQARTFDTTKPSGMIVAGGFGTGKSHLLEELKHQALQAGFAVSKIAVSKEVALDKPTKVMQAAIANLEVRGCADNPLTEIVTRVRTDTPQFHAFRDWALSPSSTLAAVFPMSIALFQDIERTDLEALDVLIRLWSGGTLQTSELKAIDPDLFRGMPLQAFPGQVARARQAATLVPRILSLAGVTGWVILLDEIELISRYGPLTRAMAYEQLAHWLGLDPRSRVEGLVTVATVTDDYSLAVLHVKNDLENVPLRLENHARQDRRDAAPHAVAAMTAIEHDAFELLPPGEAYISEVCETVREMYETAYACRVEPPLWSYLRGRPMRSYVRRWINEWDLRRFYSGRRVNLVEERVVLTYDEDDNND